MYDLFRVFGSIRWTYYLPWLPPLENLNRFFERPVFLEIADTWSEAEVNRISGLSDNWRSCNWPIIISHKELFGNGSRDYDSHFGQNWMKQTGDQLIIRADVKYVKLNPAKSPGSVRLEVNHQLLYELGLNSDFALVSSDGTETNHRRSSERM